MQMKYLRDHPDMSYGSNKQWNQLCELSCFSCFYRFGAEYKETENAIGGGRALPLNGDVWLS